MKPSLFREGFYALIAPQFFFYSMIDDILDSLWLKITTLFTFLGDLLYQITSILHPLGPAATIALLAFATVCLTKLLNRLIITKRYRILEKNFYHWKEIRDNATAYEDREKGGRMARNIDQAELNKVYYDYFFEGLLLGLARKIIPVILIVGFVNQYYSPKYLEKLFGHTYILTIPTTNNEPLLMGAIFWYLICLLGGYILWSIAARILRSPHHS